MGNKKQEQVGGDVEELEEDDFIRELDPSDLEKSRGGTLGPHRSETSKCPPGQGGSLF